jgi:hypothetical protein
MGVRLRLWLCDVYRYQFDKLRAYVRRIYDSVLLEKFVLRVGTLTPDLSTKRQSAITDRHGLILCLHVCQFFVDTLHANEQRKVAPQMTSWDSLGTLTNSAFHGFLAYERSRLTCRGPCAVLLLWCSLAAVGGGRCDPDAQHASSPRVRQPPRPPRACVVRHPGS